MDVLIRSLLWLSFLYVLNLGLKTARSQQQQKAEAKQENDIFFYTGAERNARRGWHDTWSI